MATPKWNDDRTSQLTEMVGTETPVSAETVERVATALETSGRSVAAKLRKMGYEVASTAKATGPKYTPEQEEAIAAFVVENSGNLTYAEIGAAFGVSAKSMQGKILSMQLTQHVKPTPKVEVVRSFTDAEEATFVKLANNGSTLEDIASALGRELPAVRGKALSLLRSGDISAIPKQATSTAKPEVDVLGALGDISGMTVEAIAAAINKTPRGVKTMLTRRKLVAADYDGAAKAAKAEASAE
jgi:hypothetical protein